MGQWDVCFAPFYPLVFINAGGKSEEGGYITFTLMMVCNISEGKAYWL